jgi:hypothetical protein
MNRNAGSAGERPRRPAISITGERRSWRRGERGRKNLVNRVRGLIEQTLRLVWLDYPKSNRSRLLHPFLEQAPGFFSYLPTGGGQVNSPAQLAVNESCHSVSDVLTAPNAGERQTANAKP